MAEAKDVYEQPKHRRIRTSADKLKSLENFMFHYQTSKCRFPYCPTEFCPKVHRGQSIRRNPKINFYSPHVKCKQHSAKNGCPQKDKCPNFHTPQERSFHPELYKVRECKRPKCKYENNTIFCSYAHNDEEVRKPDRSYEPGKQFLELKERNLKKFDKMMTPIPGPDSVSDTSSRLPSSIGGSSFSRTQKTPFEPYYHIECVNGLHEKGDVVKGTLKVYPNYQVQVTPLEDEPFGTRKITIIGNILRNRALQDDIVAVELLYGGKRDYSDTESIKSHASSETGYAEDSDEEELRIADAGKTVYGKVVALLGGQRRRRYICKSGVYSLFKHLRHKNTGGNMDFQCIDSKTGPPKFEVPKDEIFGITPESKYYVIEFVEWGEDRRFPKGKFIRVLECNPEIPGTELDKIVGIDMLLVELNLEHFPKYMKRHEALSEHQSFDFDQGECKERMDLTQGAEQRYVFTIDNETTKDVDDALSLKSLGSEKKGKNLYEVGIHIADVSHYVREGSEVDKAAETLTSSLYLEDTYNMLPKPLMETCSLLPGKDRLAISVFFVISESGKITGKPRFEKTVVKSSHKLVYEDVQDFFDQPEGKRNYDHIFPVDLQEALLKLKSLAKVLLKKRIEQGAVELRTKADVDAHQVVQEFMILTNHAVANRLLQFREEFGGACLLRNQPATKSVAKLSVILRKHFGIEPDKNLQNSHVINELYRQIAEQSKKKAAVFKCRMEKKHTSASEYAQYDEKNDHFLMAKPYTHFTSPIRRYVDLCVHRYIKNTMKKKSECPKGIRYMKQFNAHARKIKDSRYAWDRIKAFLPLKYKPQQYCGIIAEVEHNHCEVLIGELDRTVKVPYDLLRPDETEYDELQNRMTLSWKGTSGKVKHVIKMFGDLNVQVTGNLEVFPPELQLQLVWIGKVGWICAYHNNAPDCFGSIEPQRPQQWVSYPLREYTRKYTRITETEAAHSSIQENYSETYPNMNVKWSVDYDVELGKNNVLLYAVLPYYKSEKFGPKEGDYVCMRYTEIAASPLVLHGLVEQRYEFRFEIPEGMLDVVLKTPTWTIEIIAKSPSHRVQLKSLLRVRKETGSVMHKLKSEEFKTPQNFKFNVEEMHSLCLPQMTRREFSVKLRKTTGRKLNAVQRDACQQALQSRISLIWGPPGTGKTETSAVLIQEIVNYRRGLNKEWTVSGIPDNLKIVMASTSNKSVDNMTEKLKTRGVKVVRVYARYVESVDLKDGYEGITFKSDAHSVPNSIHEIALHRIIRNRETDLSRKFVEYEQMCKKQKSLSKKNKTKLRNMKHQLEKRNIGHADVICCTAMVVAEQRVLGLFANTVIFDEAAQATEAETVTAICNASHIVLVGDHKQLSPVVNAKGRAKELIQVSLFEHIHQSKKLKVPCTQLEVQYRMHPSISKFPSDAFYDGKLRNEKKQKTERKSDLADGNLPTFSIIPHPQNRVMFYQVMGSQKKCGTTYINTKEAQAVIRCVKALNEKVSLSSISILSPYKGQVDLIKRLLKKQNLSEKIAGTLHSYQGSEHDYVIISWVRSGGKRDLMALKIVQNYYDHETSKRLLGELLGFVSDDKQLCVAITRAKYGLVHIGNNKLFKYSPVWKRMLDRLQHNGCISTNRRLALRKPRPPPDKPQGVSIVNAFDALLTRSESEIHRNESVSAITSPNPSDTTVGTDTAASTPGKGQGPYDDLHHTFPIANPSQLQPPQLHPALGLSKSYRRKRRRRRKTKADMVKNSAPFG